MPRTDETFLDGGFAREKRRGDLTRTKTAKRFKRQRGLRLLWHKRMTTGKHQSQPVILDFTFEQRRVVLPTRRALLDKRDDRGLLCVENLFAPEQIEREIFCGLGEPCRWIFWNTVVRPGLECAHQRFLNDIFGHLQPLNPKQACQDRDELA